MERERVLTRHQVRLGESDREREGENSDNESTITEEKNYSYEKDLRQADNAQSCIVVDNSEVDRNVNSQGSITDQQRQCQGINSQVDIERAMNQMQNKMSNIESS